MAVPAGHPQIARGCNDKPATRPARLLFRQWIGAIELGFVLDTLLGVTHKVRGRGLQGLVGVTGLQRDHLRFAVCSMAAAQGSITPVMRPVACRC